MLVVEVIFEPDKARLGRGGTISYCSALCEALSADGVTQEANTSRRSRMQPLFQAYR